MRSMACPTYRVISEDSALRGRVGRFHFDTVCRDSLERWEWVRVLRFDDLDLLLTTTIPAMRKVPFYAGFAPGDLEDKGDSKVTEPMASVKPLRSKTMTLSELQLRTLDVLRKVRFQLGRAAHEEGMSDAEFVDEVIDSLSTDIYQDRQVLKIRYADRRRDRSSKSLKEKQS